MTGVNKIRDLIEKRWKIILAIILFVNLLLRLIVFVSTELFAFGDYRAYLEAVDRIAAGEDVPLVANTFIYTISYIAYFIRHLSGNINLFFILNCISGTLATWIISLFSARLSGKYSAAIITALLLSAYTEFMVFSSVFYTPVIMILLLSAFLFLLNEFYRPGGGWYSLAGLAVIYILTFFFKPELVFLPFFLIVLILFTAGRDRILARKSIIACVMMLAVVVLVKISGLYSTPGDQPRANDFIFFGHTPYGGDGGEGSFVYPANEERYNAALEAYLAENNIRDAGRQDINDFHKQEIIKFVTQHPAKWVRLQFTKFFRLYGVVPESNSFKVLYTGLLKDRLWLISVLVVAPVALVIMLFVLLFRLKVLKQLLKDNPFTAVYLLLFAYYIIATAFFGHYQERYRMPVMVCFVIPLLSVFIVKARLADYLKKPGIYIRSAVAVLFLVVWIFQARNALANTNRLEKAIDDVEKIVCSED